MKLKKGIKDLVAEAEAEIETIDAAEAIKALGDDRFVFVDIRDVRELDRDGMIPNAVHAPRGMLEFWVDPDSPYHKDVFAQDDKTYVLYCAAAWRSALATKTLQDMGMTNVKHFSNGFNGWKEAGGPVAERPKKG
ncbi:MAG: rhodanese-like domain-containing protein [Proteobacteria bacterium]|nr:rhodanese-like domain-containing protein [Pseudomonadota bacterium]